MTTTIYFSSNKLGDITNQQLQFMLDRFNLGKFISSDRTAYGVMQQTMFVSSTKGDFVLKGNPLFDAQFIEEKYFVDQLHQHTKLNVPSPYLIDKSDDIFGWRYSLMPRLPGSHINASDIQAQLTTMTDKERIAELMAQTLVELHSWKVKQYGEFDPKSYRVRPFEGSYRIWLYNTIRYWIHDATKYSSITSQDMDWVEHILQSSQHVFDSLHSPNFVMGDFKPENFLINKQNNEWKISGVFDFTTSYFGDGVADLPKMTAIYWMNGEKNVAQHFLSRYMILSEQQSFKERFKVHMLHHCVLLWGCAKATNTVTWEKDLSFAQWAERFTDSLI
ncbi:aminoglycoside phosphotransferase family protein [Paenibacillus sp. FA6]|uniref:aminoglycoside phosphotransferase family protein n=1 Tax=Paenibacillus sp. FA6 TaxID=3413029 RepID=UPI003F655E8C